jgi:hypothetical protein
MTPGDEKQREHMHQAVEPESHEPEDPESQREHCKRR